MIGLRKFKSLYEILGKLRLPAGPVDASGRDEAMGTPGNDEKIETGDRDTAVPGGKPDLSPE
jgi:hypothetical protein